MNIALALLSILLCSLAFAAKWGMDTLKHKYSSSPFAGINRQYWNPKVSWKNKYKYGIKKYGAKFPGSTTVFCFLSDGWHLFQFIFLNCLIASVFAWPYRSLWGIVIGFMILRGVGGIVFEGLEKIYINDSRQGK